MMRRPLAGAWIQETNEFRNWAKEKELDLATMSYLDKGRAISRFYEECNDLGLHHLNA